MIDEIDVLDEIDAPEAFPLAQVEQQTLERCEAVIGQGRETFLQVGAALSEIQHGKLYRAHYDTFEEYCRDRWDMGRGRAYQLMSSSKVASELSTMVDKPPKNEREAREIAKSAPADRPRVIERATELAGDQPRTAKHIERAREEIAAPDLPPEFAIIQRRYEQHGHTLSAAWDGTTRRYVVRKDGGTGVVRGWPDVLAKLERLEDQEEYDAEHPAQVEARQQAAHDHLISNRVSYEASEETDLILIGKAEQAIAQGDTERARVLLDQVEVSTWKRDQLLTQIDGQRAAGRSITLTLTPDDCAALLREARMFSSSELTKRLPVIGQTLILLIEAIKGAQ